MSLDQTISNKTINSKYALATPLRIIKDLFDYYKGREYSLVNLARKHGATGNEIADALDVDPAIISRNYPKEDK